MRSNPRLIIIVVAICLAVSGAIAWRQISAKHPPLRPIVLNALFHDNNPANYTATATTTMPYCGHSVESRVRIVHGNTAEEVVYPTHGGKAMFSRTSAGTNLTYMPSSNTLLVSRTAPLLKPADRARLLLANYDLQYGGTQQVAGHSAYVVRLVPRHEDRPSRTLWIDQRHSVVLRTLDYSYAGVERGTMQITKIDYKPAASPTLLEQLPGKANQFQTRRPATIAEINRALGIAVSEPTYVPVGFKIEGRHIFHPTCGCCADSAQLTYTDGLNVISVFERLAGASCKAGCCSIKGSKAGKCNMRGCEMAGSGQITRDGKTIVVVADLPADEIQRIAQSVK